MPAATAVTFTENEHELLDAIVPLVRLIFCDPAAVVVVPLPQEPLSPLGVDTTMPAGSASLNATAVSASPEFGFVMMKLSDVEPASPIEATPNTALMLGGVAIAREEEAEFPVPPLVEVIAPVVFRKVPAALAVTLTAKVHEPLAGILPPVKLIPPEPAPAVIVPLPHEPVSPFGVATASPEGSTSVNAIPASGTVFAAGFVIVKLRTELAPGAILPGANAVASEGGATMVRLDEAAGPVPPSVEVTALVVLINWPAIVPVTFTVNVHEPIAAIVAPDRLTTFVPCVPVIVPPPQLPVRPFGVDIISPAGNVSLKPMPLSD